MTRAQTRPTFLHIIPEYKAGDPAPEGYVEWHAWAEAQARAGLKQTFCKACKRFYYPSEKHKPHRKA